MRRAILLVLVAAAVTGALVMSASGREVAPAPEPKRAVRAQSASPELPPLPEMRGTVVEPVAGDTSDEAAVIPDPGLEDIGPKPTRPASAGTPRRRLQGGGTDVSRATALANGVALPPLEAPEEVKQIIEAGNIIARSPYKWGGGHGRWKDSGYDCSGSVSFALAAAGLLEGPLASGPLMQWGEPGRGKWVTIWTNPGHVFMEVAGIRFDTSGRQVTGSRWQSAMRSTGGFVARHPAGL
jgi:hypothetical protein